MSLEAPAKRWGLPLQGRLALVAVALACLPLAACDEETKAPEVLVELAVSPARLNYRDDVTSVVTATVYNQDSPQALAAFRIDAEALASLAEAQRGAGGFQELSNTLPPAAGEELPQSMAAVFGAEGMAQVRFRCTAEGRVPLVVREVAAGIESDPKWVTCFYRDPDAFVFTVDPERATTPLGGENAIHITVDDQHGGSQLAGRPIQIRAPEGGTFLPEQDSPVSRSLEADGTLGLAVPSQSVKFVCPQEVGLYQIVADFAQKDEDGDSSGFTFVYCSSEDVRNVILLEVRDSVLEADGESETVVVASVLGPNGAEPNREVVLSTDRGSLRDGDGNLRSRITGVTDDEGRLEATFVSGTDAGEATLKATAELTGDPEIYRPEGSITVEGQVSLKIVGASFVRFISSTPEVLGVKGSGFNESARVTFQVVGSDGEPFPAGLRVTFQILSNVGGASLTPTVRETDENGYVSTNLVSGRIAANVTVRATASQNGVAGDSPAIPIVGVRPSWGGFALACDLKNVGAFVEHDGINSLVDQDIPCRTKLKDRFGNPVGISTAVSFRSEAGTITAAVNSVAQNYGGATGSGAGQAQATTGDVAAIFNTFGVLPRNVPPMFADVRSVDEPVLDPNAPDVNPRDGFVSIMAFVAGEEWFNDANGNGEYDAGEQFVDLPEPFVDYDDNGRRDEFEPFIDLPGEDGLYNGRWDAGNRRWDRNTTIWTETRIVYSGLPLNRLPYDPYADSEGGMHIILGQDEYIRDPACPVPCRQGDMGEVFLLSPGENCMVFAQAVDARGNILNGSADARFEVDAPPKLVDQAPATAGDEYGICWGFTKDCGPNGLDPICTVTSAISCYNEFFPAFPSRCASEPLRRFGHMHWAQLAHPITETSPYDPPPQMQVAVSALRFTVSLRVSPRGGNVVHTHRYSYWGATEIPPDAN